MDFIPLFKHTARLAIIDFFRGSFFIDDGVLLQFKLDLSFFQLNLHKSNFSFFMIKAKKNRLIFLE